MGGPGPGPFGRTAKPAPKPTPKPAPPTSQPALPGVIETRSNADGDRYPAPVILDWGDQFEIEFGARTTSYGDVRLQICIRYLGDSAASDAAEKLIDIDPAPGYAVLGQPHTRRVNARIVDYGSSSLTLDVYGDGSAYVDLFDEPQVSSTGVDHRIHYEFGTNLEGLLTIETGRFGPILAGGGTLVRADEPAQEPALPDDAIDSDIPTSVLLQMAIGRLGALGEGTPRLLELDLELVATLGSPARADEDLGRSTLSGADDPGLRARTLRLLGVLATAGPVFANIAPMLQPDAYMEKLATDAILEVGQIIDLYSRAIVAAWEPGMPGEVDADLQAAQHRFAEFPVWLTRHYLRDPRGVPGLIDQIAEFERAFAKLRWEGRVYDNVSRRASDIAAPMLEAWPSVQLRNRRDQLEQAWRDERGDVLDDIMAFYAEIQLALGLIIAMTTHAELVLYEDALDSWTNDVWDRVPFTKNTQRAADTDAEKMRVIVDAFTAAYDGNVQDAQGKDVPRATLAQQALTSLAAALGTINPDLDSFQSRVKWVDRVNIAGKIALVVAAAALTGGVAGGLAGTALATAETGGFYVWAGSLIVEGFAFTAVSRIGTQALIGDPGGSFINDWGWNTITLGWVKGLGKLFEIPADAARFTKLGVGAGRLAAAMVSLHGIGELQYRLSQGTWMSSDERAGAIFQNIAVSFGLEAGRFITEPLQKRLTQTVGALILDKLRTRVEALETERVAISQYVDGLARGELHPVEVRELFGRIEELWAKELTLLRDAAQNGIIDEADYKASLAPYEQRVAGMELRMAQLGIKQLDTSYFRPMSAPGFVAFTPEGRAQLEKLYAPDPNMPGKSLTESTTMPGVLEGRLPTGELTYYVPDAPDRPNIVPGSQTGANVVAARDMAVLVTKGGEPEATKGMQRLEAGLGDGTATPFTTRQVDEILASLDPEHVPAFLRALGDPAFTSRLPFAFYTGLAARGAAIDFARAYGAAPLEELYQKFGWTAACDQALEALRSRLESAGSAEARARALTEFANATPADLDRLIAGARAALISTATSALGPAPAGGRVPTVELVPHAQLGGGRSSAKIVLENGRVVSVLIDENATVAAVREELRHAVQARDPRFAPLFEAVDLGKPYEQYTPAEKLAAHAAAVKIELADKLALIAELRTQSGPLADEEMWRAYEDVNNLRARQLALGRITADDLRGGLPAELRDPAELHARGTAPSLRVDPGFDFSKRSLGDFRASIDKLNPDHHLSHGELEDLYSRSRAAQNPDRLPADVKFDALAETGAEQTMPLKLAKARSQDAVKISKGERGELDKLARARDKARQLRNEALSQGDEDEARAWDQQMREASHAIGESGLELWANQLAWLDGTRAKLYYRADSSRSGDFDAIYTWMGRDGVMVYWVGEGKGASAQLGGKWVKGKASRPEELPPWQYVQQGSTPYFKSIVDVMSRSNARAQRAANNLANILDFGVDLDGRKARISYAKVQVPVDLEPAPRTKLGDRSVVDRLVITPLILRP